MNDPATGAATTGAEAPSLSDMILDLASNLKFKELNNYFTLGYLLFSRAVSAASLLQKILICFSRYAFEVYFFKHQQHLKFFWQFEVTEVTRWAVGARLGSEGGGVIPTI